MILGYIANMFSFAFGGYLFGVATMKEIKHMVKPFNENLKTIPSRADIMEQLSEYIRYTYFNQLVAIANFRINFRLA